jgi:plasmid stabilization system protein ParE
VTKPVRPTEFAEEEILHEIRWYERERAGLGDRLWTDIQAITQLISDYPQIGEVVRNSRVRGTIRRFPLRHFPFFVIYREHPDHLELVALAPMSRKPNYWRSRVS